jgi:hypothetical protein
MYQDLLILLRDGVWQSVGAALAAVAILLGYLQYRSTKTDTELSFGSISIRRLISVAEEIAGHITINYKGQIVTSVYLVELGFKNSGNQPIRGQHFEFPVGISSTSSVQILSAEVTRTNPEELRITLTQVSDELRIEPVLLNSGDFFVLQILCAGHPPQFTARARIAGISKLAQLNSGQRVRPLPFFPFSHALNGAAINFYGTALIGLIALAFGNTAFGLFFIGAAGLGALFSVIHWYLGEKGRNSGRYIDAA